jgi:DHA1 family inner membrane transport protein
MVCGVFVSVIVHGDDVLSGENNSLTLIKLMPILDGMTSIKQYPASSDKTTGRLLLLAAGMFVVGTGGFVIAGVLPEIALSLRVPQTTASLLITIYAVVFAIGAPLLAIVTARMSRTGVMVAGLALLTAGNIMIVLVPTFELAMVARVVTAIGAAAFVPAATGSAASIAAPGKQGRAMSLVTAGLTAATALGAPIGTAIGAAAGWHTAIWFVVALGVLVVAGIGLALRSIPLPAPLSVRARFAPLANRRVSSTLLVTLLLTTGSYSAYTFFGAVQDRATGGNGSVLALLLFVYGAAGTIGNLLAGVLSDRFGNRRVLDLSLLVLLVDFIALPFASASLGGAVVVIALWGMATWAGFLAVQHRIVEVSPGAIAWNSSALFAGIALSGPLGAVAIGTVGAHDLTWIAAGMILLAVVAAAVSHTLIARSARAAGRAMPAGEDSGTRSTAVA